MRTISSPNFTDGRLGPPRVIVIHDVEAPEAATTAESIARYFADPKVKASAHVVVDVDSRVRCVADTDTAWAAPGANHDGLQLELAGYARQIRAQWLDAYSMRMLREQAAPQVRDWCTRWGIPMRHLTDAELRAGDRGVVGHNQVSRVYRRSTHTDPGPHFPWDVFLRLVVEVGLGKGETEDGEGDMADVDIIRAINAHTDEVARLGWRAEGKGGSTSAAHAKYSQLTIVTKIDQLAKGLAKLTDLVRGLAPSATAGDEAVTPTNKEGL